MTEHNKPRWRVCKEYWLQRNYEELANHEDIKYLVDHLRQYVEEYNEAKPDSYWHRKSGKVVLSALLVRYEGRLRCVRGINSELSLPSGSICAERAAISNALSEYLSLSRTDFLAIAVISPNDANPIQPCGVCDEWIKKIEEASPTFTVVTFTSSDMTQILEHCPVTITEEVVENVPEHLRGNWVCKCGFLLNKQVQAYCSCCKQFRFRFKTHLQKTRVDLLRIIKLLEDTSWRDLPDIVPCAQRTEFVDYTATNASDDDTDIRGLTLHVTPTFNNSPTFTSLAPPPAEPVGGTSSRYRRRTGSAVCVQSCFVLSVAKLSGLDAMLVTKTLKDLLSLKFVSKFDALGGGEESGCRCSRFVITTLGLDFLSAADQTGATA